MFCKKGCSKKFRKSHRETPVLESLFNKVAGLRCFRAKFAKFLRAPILKNIACEQLLLHFVISFLPKIEELQYVTKNSYAAVTGISETKLDNTLYELKIAIDGYNTVQNDKKREVGGVAS